VAVPNFLVTFCILFVLLRCQCEIENTSKYGTDCKNESPRLFYGQFCSIGWPRKMAKSDRVTSSVPHFRFPTPISASVRLTGRSSLTFIQRILFSGGGNQCNCYCFLPPPPPHSLPPNPFCFAFVLLLSWTFANWQSYCLRQSVKSFWIPNRLGQGGQRQGTSLYIYIYIGT